MNQQSIQKYLDACALTLHNFSKSNALAEGKKIHANLMKSINHSSSFVDNNLINMYAKCGDIEDAYQVFERMLTCNVFSWTTIISAYAQHCEAKKAFALFQSMKQENERPNIVTYVSILTACSSDMTAVEYAKLIHAEALLSMCGLNVFIGTSLVDIYLKAERLQDALYLFDRMPERNVFTWTAIIAGYAELENSKDALKLFLQMQIDGVQPNKVTHVCVLSAYDGSLSTFELGKCIHASILKMRWELDFFVNSALVDMYASHGSIKDARLVFDSMERHNVVSWNAIIKGYAHCREGKEAFKLFRKMQKEDVLPNSVTYVGVLSASISVSLEQGKWLHASALKALLGAHVFVGNTLLDMYARFGSIKDAFEVFHKMPARSLVTWNTLIAGYVQHGNGEEAIELLKQMQESGVEPDNFTFISIVSLCSSIADLRHGKQVHASILKLGCEFDDFVACNLLDMYSKCGTLQYASQLFCRMPKRGLVSWNAIIAGHVQKGNGRKTIELFQEMEQEGVSPDDVTFLSILVACCHACLLNEGCHYYLNSDRGITPSESHYACVVGLFGHAGQIDEAEELIQMMPFTPNAAIWTSLVGACMLNQSCTLQSRGRITLTHFKDIYI